MPVDFICGPSASEFSPNILAYWYLVIYIYVCSHASQWPFSVTGWYVCLFVFVLFIFLYLSVQTPGKVIQNNGL